MMYDRTMENRLHLFEDITSDNHDTIYELFYAFFDLCKILSRKDVLTDDEFNNIVNKRRYKPTGESAPVVHAHKVRAHSQGGGTHWVICSNCEKPIDWEDSYCKHCGAKMDEEVQ